MLIDFWAGCVIIIVESVFMRSYIIEFIGTFFLVLTIAFSGNPLAIGLVLAALVYMGGYISGGHYNPAVTLAVLLTKNVKPRVSFLYIIFQILGGLAAAVVFGLVSLNNFVPSPAPTTPINTAILLEVLYTFLLCSVVLHAAVSDKTKGNNYFGLAIGLTVLAGAYSVGPISGGAFNPAVAIGPILYDSANLSQNLNNLLVYLIGPFLGAALAALVYKIK